MTLGELLDINFQSVYESNKNAILTKALFDLCWMGDEATIKEMLLIKMLEICDYKPPDVTSICDCIRCMGDDRKNDVEYIMIFSK